MDLLLCWQAASQAPAHEGQLLLSQVLQGDALRQSQAALPKRSPQRRDKTAAEATTTCSIEVLSVQTVSQPDVSSSRGSTAVVHARIVLVRGVSTDAVARSAQRVAVSLSRVGGALSPWKIACINELSGR